MSAGTSQTGFSLRTLARSAAVLTGGTAAAQGIAILRELFVASQVGVSSAYDAVLIALIIPTTLAALTTSGLATALIPAYVALQQEQGRPQASRLASMIVTWVSLATILMAVVLVVAAGPLVTLVGPGLSAEAHAQSVNYLVLLSPVVVVLGLTAILNVICQAEGRFGMMAWAAFLGPATAFAFMLLRWDASGLQALVEANVIGPAITVVMLFLGTLRASVRLRPTMVARDLGVRALVRHAAPLTVSSAVLQLTVVADRAIASLIAPGAVSALRYAEVLVRLPIGAIGPAWGNAVYPTLVRATHSAGVDTLGSVTMRLLRLTIIAFLPIAALTIAVAPAAVGVAYGRGAFTSADLMTTAQVVAAFAPLIVLLMVNPVIVDSLNARRRGAVLLAGGIANAVINAVLDVVFGLTIGVAGIALATSCTITIVLFVVLAPNLARSEPEFSLRALARPVARAFVALLPGTLLFGALAWSGMAPTEGLGALAFLALAGVAGLAIYAGLAIRLGLEEPTAFVAAIRSRLARGSAPTGSPSGDHAR
ncbi:MAG: lipid II flippase MurJ [Chloroflexota bacterium]